MKYATGHVMKIGDEVIADGMPGVIVCDFDQRQFVTGFENWDIPTVELIGGGTLACGVMIETQEAGLIHYEKGIGNIEFVRASRTD